MRRFIVITLVLFLVSFLVACNNQQPMPPTPSHNETASTLPINSNPGNQSDKAIAIIGTWQSRSDEIRSVRFLANGKAIFTVYPYDTFDDMDDHAYCGEWMIEGDTVILLYEEYFREPKGNSEYSEDIIGRATIFHIDDEKLTSGGWFYNKVG